MGTSKSGLPCVFRLIKLSKKPGEKIGLTLPILGRDRHIEIANVPQNLPSDVRFKVSRFKAEISLPLDEWLSMFPTGASPSRLMLTVKLNNPIAAPTGHQKPPSKAPQSGPHANLKRSLVVAGLAIIAYMFSPELPGMWAASMDTTTTSSPSLFVPIIIYATMGITVALLVPQAIRGVRHLIGLHQETPGKTPKSKLPPLYAQPTTSAVVDGMLNSLETAIEAKQDENPTGSR